MPPKTNFLFGSSPDFEISRCCVCYNTYNRTNRAPISMPCGHTFCHGCIRHMTTGILFSCGVCRTVSPVGWTGTKKNVTLIQALDKMNLLASDDTFEVLNSTPLGSNRFLQNEVNKVDFNDMLYHSKHSLKIISAYLKSRYGMSITAVQTIDKAVEELELLKANPPIEIAQGPHNDELDRLIAAFYEAANNIVYNESLMQNYDFISAELGRIQQDIENNSFGVNDSNMST